MLSPTEFNEQSFYLRKIGLYNFTYHLQFFTATILEWKNLLQKNEYQDIVIESLRFFKKEGSIIVYGFVIMPDHLQLIWQVQDGFEKEKIQMRMLKFTGQQMKFRLKEMNAIFPEEFKVNTGDREYQFWERNALGIDLWNEKVFIQKLNYIHNNPVHPKWNLATSPENYKYSSAKFYETGVDDFGILTHYNG